MLPSGRAVISSIIAAVLLILSTTSPIPAIAQPPTPEAPTSRLPGAVATIDAAQYPSLQAALDAVPDSGGYVKLPAGTFEIDEPLVVTHGECTIEGSGAATHIINRNENGKPALILQHPDGARVANDDRLWRIMLSKLRLSGNPNSGAGIEAIRIQEVFLQAVTVSHHGGDGIRLDHCYEDPRISNCLITYNGAVGLNLLGCHDIVVSACQFEENQDAIHCIDSFNLCLTGSCLDDHLRHGVVIENTYGSVVSGNMIEECQQTALIMDRDCYGNTISANVIAHNGAGVDLRDAHGCAISANTFTIMKHDALRIGPNSGRITVTGNNFSNSFAGETIKRADDDQSAGGLTIDSASNVLISGNVFAGLTAPAIKFESSQREPSQIQFPDNLAVDNAQDVVGLPDQGAN